MKQLSLPLCLLVILMLACTRAQAEEIAVLSVDIPPYGYTEHGQPAGLIYELSNLIAVTAGYTPKNKLVSLPQVIKGIQKGQASFAILIPKPDLKNLATPLGVVLPLKTMFLGRKDATYRNLRDIRGKRIAIVKGSQRNDYVTHNKLIPVPTENRLQSLKLLLSGKVDAIVGPMLGIKYTINKQSLPKQAFGSPMLLAVAPGTLYVSNANSDEEMRTRLASALSQLIHDGAIDALIEKY